MTIAANLDATPVSARKVEQVQPIISARDLRASYAGRQVLSDINLDLANSEVLCLIGHNGAGKSTLLKILFGLHSADGGQIRLRDQIIKPHPADMARDGVAYVPQGRGVFASRSVQENFALAAWSAGLSRGEASLRIDEVIELLPKIGDFWKKRAGRLSGGQQQMVSLGRALLSRPSILLLDEPSIGLAPKLFQDLLAPIRVIQKQRGMSILLVEQNVREAFGISDRVVAMKSGSIVFKGVPADLSDPVKLLELF